MQGTNTPCHKSVRAPSIMTSGSLLLQWHLSALYWERLSWHRLREGLGLWQVPGTGRTVTQGHCCCFTDWFRIVCAAPQGWALLEASTGHGCWELKRELVKKLVSLLEGAIPQIHWVLDSEAPICLRLWPRVGFLDELPEPGLTSALVSCVVEGCQGQALS